MNATNKSLLNIILSVLAPVMILEHCSESGPSLWHVGSNWALAIALALPLSYGLYSFIESRKADPINLLGLTGVILTALVSLYASQGEQEAIRPDAPYWFAAKEALIPCLMAAAILITARSEGSLLRVFIYTDSLFDITSIEARVKELGRRDSYQRVLMRASQLTAGSLILSSAANLALALYYLLPVLSHPAAKQAAEYNYAVSSMTWQGYVVIGIPLMLTLIAVMRYLIRELSTLCDLPRERITLS